MKIITSLLDGRLKGLLSLKDDKPINKIILHLYTERDVCGWCSDMLANFSEVFNECLQRQAVRCWLKTEARRLPGCEDSVDALVRAVEDSFNQGRSQFLFTKELDLLPNEIKKGIQGYGKTSKWEGYIDRLYVDYMKKMQDIKHTSLPELEKKITPLLSDVQATPSSRFLICVSSSDRYLSARMYGCDLFLTNQDILEFSKKTVSMFFLRELILKKIRWKTNTGILGLT